MTVPLFAKLETFPDIGQVLAVIEETAEGDPCVSLRVSSVEPGYVIRTEYTFQKAADPEAATDAFFTDLTRADLETMGRALFEQGRDLIAAGGA